MEESKEKICSDEIAKVLASHGCQIVPALELNNTPEAKLVDKEIFAAFVRLMNIKVTIKHMPQNGQEKTKEEIKTTEP